MIKYSFLFILLIASLIGLCTVQADENFLQRKDVQAFIQDLVVRDGFSRTDLEKIFSQVRSMPEVVHHMQHPAEAMLWNDYETLFITQKRINAGVDFSHEHMTILNNTQQHYGVPASIIVAILGVESNYGTHVMKYRAIDALAHLAFNYPSRQTFFQAELKAFLELTRKYHLQTFSILSSYAGAIGPAQFMPDSVLNDAVVTPGDSNLNSAGDWVESIGNYLLKRGWLAKHPIATPIACPKVLPKEIVANSRKNFYSPQQLKAAGIANNAAEDAMFIQLQTKSGNMCWLGYHNFGVILRYNTSPLYAMAVNELSDNINQDLGRKN